MIKSFYFHNFKSFTNLELNISDLGVFIGSNISNEKDILEGLKILYESVYGKSFSMIINGSRNIPGVINSILDKSFNKSFELGCTWSSKDLSKNSSKNSYKDLSDDSYELIYRIKIDIRDDIRLKEESLKKRTYKKQILKTDDSDNNITEKDIIEKDITENIIDEEIFTVVFSDDSSNNPSNGSSGKMLKCYFNGIDYKDDYKNKLYINNNISVLSQMAYFLTEQWPEIELFLKALKSMFFFQPRVDKMRDYAHIGDHYNDGHVLRADGSNLSAILYELCSENGDEIKNSISSALRIFDNSIENVDFIKTSLDHVMLSLKANDELIDIRRLPDNVLRWLSLLAAVYSEKPGSMIIMKDLDGLYFSCKPLLNAIYQIQKERNITLIIITHNSVLMNLSKNVAENLPENVSKEVSKNVSKNVSEKFKDDFCFPDEFYYWDDSKDNFKENNFKEDNSKEDFKNNWFQVII